MKRVFLVCLPALFLWASSWTASGFSGDLHIEPSSIRRGLFVEKTSLVTFRGAAPEGSQIVIKVVGPERDFKLNQAGKVLGFLWAPVTHGLIRNLPEVYALLSSVKVAEALSPEEQAAARIFPDFREGRQFGRVSFQGERGPEEAQALSRDFLEGLIRLLRQKGLYRHDEKAVQISGGRFQAALLLPAGVPLGEYRISAYSLEGGKARYLAGGSFSADTEGLAAWLSRQARDNSTAYGIIAVLIALGAGALVGFIFQVSARR